jgi:hypothetical protein
MVFAIQKGGSRDPEIMTLLRTLSYIAATHDFQFHAEHIAGKVNIGPDLLSRGDVFLFQQQFPKSNPYPVKASQLLCHTW